MKIKQTIQKYKTLITVLAVAVALVGANAVYAATTVKVVTPNDMATSFADVTSDPSLWFFYNDETDTIDNLLGSFVNGPDTAPAGNGGVEISVSGNQRRNLATYQFSGTPLSDITVMSFSTYNPSAGNGGSATRSGYLNFNVDFNGTDSWQRRLVYVPSINGAVTQDTWQEWNTIAGGEALWTWSGYFSNGGMWPDGNTSQYRKWSDIVAAFPSSRVRVTDSWLGVRVGEPYANGYTENIDAFKFGTSAGTTVFDFEPLVGPPTDKNECKKGGWEMFNNPSFKNQGDCVSYVNHN